MLGMSMNTIKRLCDSKALRWTNHVLIRLLQRNITTADVICTLQNGEIIEHYPTDYPYPSCLVLGLSINKQHLHVVCGISDTELWLISAYYPNDDKWHGDLKTRKEHQQ